MFYILCISFITRKINVIEYRHEFLFKTKFSCLKKLHYLKYLADTKIRYLHCPSTSNQKIVWLNVPMHYILLFKEKRSNKDPNCIDSSVTKRDDYWNQDKKWKTTAHKEIEWYDMHISFLGSSLVVAEVWASLHDFNSFERKRETIFINCNKKCTQLCNQLLHLTAWVNQEGNIHKQAVNNPIARNETCMLDSFMPPITMQTNSIKLGTKAKKFSICQNPKAISNIQWI